MSYFDRAGRNANSAVLVSVSPEDFGGGPLGGAEFIQRLEQQAFQMGRSGKAPAALTREFIAGGSSFTLGRVEPTYSLGVEPADLNRLSRNESGFAACADNLFPCGEGCGYAGGIMSAAVDGIKTAVRIMEKYSPDRGE